MHNKKPTCFDNVVPIKGEYNGAKFEIHRAKYAQGQMLVIAKSDDEYKTIVSRLIEALNGRFTGRENGYILSPRKVMRLIMLMENGWDASYFGELKPPDKPKPFKMPNIKTIKVGAENE